MRQPERQHNRKGVRETSNQKYEITDIAHEKYPFLHRIRALRDIRPDIKAGDLGGFIESESNLSTELEDNAWIYDDAVVCNNGYAWGCREWTQPGRGQRLCARRCPQRPRPGFRMRCRALFPGERSPPNPLRPLCSLRERVW